MIYSYIQRVERSFGIKNWYLKKIFKDDNKKRNFPSSSWMYIYIRKLNVF